MSTTSEAEQFQADEKEALAMFDFFFSFSSLTIRIMFSNLIKSVNYSLAVDEFHSVSFISL